MKDLRFFETESEYINEKASLEIPTVSYTKSNEKIYVKEISYVIAKYKASPEELSRNEFNQEEFRFYGLYKLLVDFSTGDMTIQEKLEIVEQSILLSYDEVNNISTYKFILKDEYEEYDFSTAFGGTFLGSGAIYSTLNYLDLSNVNKPIINLDICTNLDNLILNNKLKSINHFGLVEMNFDNNFILPSSLEFIGNNAFIASLLYKDSFKNIEHLNPKENYYWGATVVTKITEDGLYILDTTIVECRGNETEYIIPNYITEIGNNAFSHCSGLTSVIFEEDSKLTSIGAYAFNGCNLLTSIEIPNGVTYIGDTAFGHCSGLTEIVCYATVAPIIGDMVFYNVKGYGVLKVPQGSDYSSWMGKSYGNLGYLSWTIEYI